MIGQTLAFLLSATAVTLGALTMESAQPALHKRITPCNGSPIAIYFNFSKLSETNETAISFSFPTILASTYVYTPDSAPCETRFALGLSKNETAPPSISDAGWEGRLAIGGVQSNELSLDPHLISDHYNAFFVQYDPATGDVLDDPLTQAKAKICYHGTDQPVNPCAA